MSSKANYFKLGLFVITSFILGAVFLTVFGANKLFKKEILAETCFNESVQGLTIGSEVKYKGIKIGNVRAITSAAGVYDTKSDYVLVVLSLEKDIFLGQTGPNTESRVNRAIEDGLTVKLAFKGLTGAAYLETDYSVDKKHNFLTPNWEPRHIYIPSQQSRIKQFGDSINQILDALETINITEITQHIDTLLNTLNQKAGQLDMAQISQLVASLLTELKNTNEKINHTLESDRVKQFLDDAVDSFSQLRQLIESSKEPLQTAVKDFQKSAGSTRNIMDKIDQSVTANMDKIAENLDSSLESLSASSQMVETMLWTNADKIEQIMGNLEIASDNLKQLSKELKKYPARLIFGKPPEKKGIQVP